MFNFEAGGIAVGGAAMHDDEEISMMVQAARLYYEQGFTQEKVGAVMGVSRLKVNRLLAEALRVGIVRISVVDPLDNCSSVERRLVDKFGLSAAVVVPRVGEDRTMLLHVIGRAAANYLRETVHPEAVLGLGWGSSVYSTICELSNSPEAQKDVTVVPLLGGVGELDVQFQINGFAREAARMLGGTWRALHAPCLVETSEMRTVITSHGPNADVVGMWDHLDAALVGIGTVLSKSPLLQTPYFGNADILEMERCGAIGDVCSRFFDLGGVACDLSINDKLVGITLEQLKRTPMVIGVTEGPSRADTIAAAIKGGIVKALITDEKTAQTVLESKV